MFNKITKLAVLALAAASLQGCLWRGEQVEIPTAHKGKVQTSSGFEKGASRNPSKFRLSHCGAYDACERLVILDVSDNQYLENFLTYMPVDQLEMGYSITMTLAVNPAKEDFIFGNVPFKAQNAVVGLIPQNRVYATYAQPILRTKIPAILADMDIGTIASNLATVNTELLRQVGDALKKDTPFILKHIGLVNPKYPEIITKAKENAAERTEQLAQIKAKKELELADLAAEKELEAERRAVSLMKAQTESMIANKASDRYVELKKLEVLNNLAKSNNKAFIPLEMLNDNLMIEAK